MDRIKARIALLLVMSSLTTGLFAGSPAPAYACHPAPDAVCNAKTWVVECVVWYVKYGYTADYCST